MNDSVTIKPISLGDASVTETLLEVLNNGVILDHVVNIMSSDKTVRLCAEMAKVDKRCVVVTFLLSRKV